AFNCCESVGWATLRRRAARLTLASLAIAWKARRCWWLTAIAVVIPDAPGSNPKLHSRRRLRVYDNSVPVAVDGVPERGLERAEPGFVLAPLVQSGGEDRLAPLLGAGRAHAAAVGVEFDAGRLELQAAVAEDPPHRAFQVLDHVLVVDPQDPAGQGLVPMAH